MPISPVPREDVPHVLVSRERRTPAVVELTLEPAAEPVSFLPGQYVQVCDEDYRIALQSYSVANAPHESGRLTLLVTEVQGGRTSPWLAGELAPGDVLLVCGPYGTFVADPDAGRPVLGLAGGSGLAPIRSLAEEAVRRGVPDPFTVLFSARTEEDVLGREQFAAWEREHEGMRFVRTLTRADGEPPLGRVPEVLSGVVADLSGYDVFVAGAPGFVAASARAARDLGCPPGRLHTEEFYAEPQPWGTHQPGGTR